MNRKKCFEKKIKVKVRTMQNLNDDRKSFFKQFHSVEHQKQSLENFLFFFFLNFFSEGFLRFYNKSIMRSVQFKYLANG